MPEDTVLVTGASGFIGGRLVERLAMDRSARPRGMILSWSRAAGIARFDVDIAIADIMRPAEVAAAVRPPNKSGATHVVHCAYTDDPQVIVEGTRNLLAAALQAGVKRFVFLSTAEVYGPNATGVIEETAPTIRGGRPYADAKIDAEACCREYGERGLPVTILRPAIVYGPFGKSWTVGIAKRLQSGYWGEFRKHGDGYCNAVYVDDLVSAIQLALARDTAIGQAFNINGPDVVTWNEYFRRFNSALQLPPLSSKSPARSAIKSAVVERVRLLADAVRTRFEDRLMEIYLRGGLASRLMQQIKTLLQSTPSQGELVDLFGRRAIYSDGKASWLLGYGAQFDLERGLELCALWLADGGFVEAGLPVESSEQAAASCLAVTT